MPEKKKSTKSAGKSQTKSSVKSSGKNTNTRSTKTTTKSPAKAAPVWENAFLRTAAPYILAAVAVLLAVCVIFGEGRIGGGIRNVLTGLFSGAAYVLPIAMLIRTFTWNRDAEEEQLTGRSACLGIDFLLLAAFLHVVGGGEATLKAAEHYEDGMELIGGGVFGGILGELLLRGFGKVCTIIILIAAIVLLALYIAGLTPRSVFIYIAYKIKFAGEQHAERRERAEEKRKNAKPTKNQIREEEYLAYLREKKQREREAKKNARQDSRQDAQNHAANPVQNAENSGKNTRKSGRNTGEQIPLANPQATVYHVRRHKIAEMDAAFSDTPVDDVEPEIPAAEAFLQNDAPVVDDMPTDEIESVGDTESAQQNNHVNQAAVDERIFDEVMKRTRERIEKSRKAEGIKSDVPVSAQMRPVRSAEMPAKKVPVTDTKHDFAESGDATEIIAGDVLDAVEIAAMEMRGKTQNTTGSDADLSGTVEEIEEISEAVPAEVPEQRSERQQERQPEAAKIREDETDTVKLATAESDEFDVTKIFVNPEDAELLDKLSEQYRQPLDVQRTTVSAPTQAPVKPAKPSIPPYQFPPTDILAEAPAGNNEDIKDELQDNAVKLVETLRNFKVSTKIENISRGPTITRYELLLDPGVRVRSVVNLVDDISLSLATTGVRIEAPIPGKAAVGIEVPNKKQTTVHLRSLIEDSRFQDAKSPLTVALGEDVAGEAVYFDIGKMPHLLIAGATGAGKSVCINSIITSLLYKASPEDVKLILIDPKKVELSIYNGIPHLLVPVVSEPKKAAGSLSWAVGEMERRYGLIEAVGVRDIKGFNEVTKNDPDYEYMPRIVIVIDELADLMMTAPDDVEDSICRIAQKARAAGMHLIIGTQRPSVDVITGLIKANVPSRIAFRTSSQIDSRTIIDVGHAANLIGMGDMLFNPVGALKPRRVQGAYVNESDVEEVVAYIKNINTAYTDFESEQIVNEIEREAQKCGAVSGKGKNAAAADDDGDDEDPMLKSAVELAIDSGKISTSLIQRRLSLGYGRAAKLIDRMEQLGYVSAPDGSKPREVLITKSEYMEMRLKDEAPFDL